MLSGMLGSLRVARMHQGMKRSRKQCINDFFKNFLFITNTLIKWYIHTRGIIHTFCTGQAYEYLQKGRTFRVVYKVFRRSTVGKLMVRGSASKRANEISLVVTSRSAFPVFYLVIILREKGKDRSRGWRREFRWLRGNVESRLVCHATARNAVDAILFVDYRATVSRSSGRARRNLLCTRVVEFNARSTDIYSTHCPTMPRENWCSSV